MTKIPLNTIIETDTGNEIQGEEFNIVFDRTEEKDYWIIDNEDNYECLCLKKQDILNLYALYHLLYITYSGSRY